MKHEYNYNGDCDSPPQPTVRPQQTEVCSFSRTSGEYTGVKGLLTYDLFKRQCGSAKEMVVIMFSVPFDRIQDKNCLAIGIYADDKECDEALYKEMYNDDPKSDSEKHGFASQEADGCIVIFKGRRFHIKATMSPVGGSVLKVEVWDKPQDD
ncbi:hypothetical protein EYF80_065636 [Liparis tanakae]|uniref:DELTA-sagatoxin-Srs1a n=1 Tax=Liparis tanakae TaxID=230148 RepID=A0A4Z2E655_9TELE|nr:hypothetical protein EYF80_065636 [Liparis tanakae]